MYISPLLTHIQNELRIIYGHVPLDSCVQNFNFIKSFLRLFSIKLSTSYLRDLLYLFFQVKQVLFLVTWCRKFHHHPPCSP